MFRVIVCGDRNWRDRETIRRALQALVDQHGLDLLVAHGDARGADTLCHELCEEMGIDEARFPANWKGRVREQDGRNVYYAGPFRNRLMLQLLQPDRVLCFHSCIERSKGTKDMRDIAVAAGVSALVIRGR